MNVCLIHVSFRQIIWCECNKFKSYITIFMAAGDAKKKYFLTRTFGPSNQYSKSTRKVISTSHQRISLLYGGCQNCSHPRRTTIQLSLSFIPQSRSRHQFILKNFLAVGWKTCRYKLFPIYLLSSLLCLLDENSKFNSE